MNKTTSVAVQDERNHSTALRPITDEFGLTNEQLALVKSQIAVGASDDELRYFLTVAKKSGLDAFTRQIYAIKRKVWNKDQQRYDEKISIQTGIDGYRAIASRTGELAGIEDATYDSEDKDHPNKASVTVWRKVQGDRVSFAASARWNEYAQTFKSKNGAVEVSGMWVKMPYLMLAKCAEALALRKAFPNELSGVYTAEEMAQADNPTATKVIEAETVDDKKKLPVKLNNAIHATWKELADLNGWDEEKSDGVRHQTLIKNYSIGTNNDLTEEQAKDFIERIKDAIKAKQPPQSGSTVAVDNSKETAKTSQEKEPAPTDKLEMSAQDLAKVFGGKVVVRCPQCGKDYEDDGTNTGDTKAIDFAGMCNACIRDEEMEKQNNAKQLNAKL